MDSQAGWLSHFLPKFGELGAGLMPRAENLIRRPLGQVGPAQPVLPPGPETIRERQAVEILALLLCFKRSDLSELRQIGALMFDQGVLGFKAKKFSSAEGMTLRTGGEVKLEPGAGTSHPA